MKIVTLNRFALLGYSLIASGLAGAAYSLANKDITSMAVSCGSIFCGAFILSGTDAGLETYRSYERTKKYIQKHKCLDKEVTDLYGKLYCKRQGVYMAAKELGYLDDYKKLMEDKNIIIPNF